MDRHPSPRSHPPLTLPEAAAYLNVSERFMRRLVAERRIAFHKVGHFLRFRVADLDRFLEAGRVEPTFDHPCWRRGRRSQARRVEEVADDDVDCQDARRRLDLLREGGRHPGRGLLPGRGRRARWWWGEQARAWGLEGTRSETTSCGGLRRPRPGSGEQLGRAFGSRSVDGIAAAFSAPKSVSSPGPWATKRPPPRSGPPAAHHRNPDRRSPKARSLSSGVGGVM